MAREKGTGDCDVCEHRTIHRNVNGTRCAPLFCIVSINPRRGNGHHDHENVSVSVLRISRENESAYVVRRLTAHGHGVHVLNFSLYWRCLRFCVSTTTSSLPSCGIYVVANERCERCANAAEES